MKSKKNEEKRTEPHRNPAQWQAHQHRPNVNIRRRGGTEAGRERGRERSWKISQEIMANNVPNLVKNNLNKLLSLELAKWFIWVFIRWKNLNKLFGQPNKINAKTHHDKNIQRQNLENSKRKIYKRTALTGLTANFWSDQKQRRPDIRSMTYSTCWGKRKTKTIINQQSDIYWTYLSKKGDKDILDWNWHIHTTIYKIDN